jgi:hypothetical protein
MKKYMKIIVLSLILILSLNLVSAAAKTKSDISSNIVDPIIDPIIVDESDIEPILSEDEWIALTNLNMNNFYITNADSIEFKDKGIYNYDEKFAISSFLTGKEELVIDSVGDVLLSNNLNVDGGYLKVGNSVSGDRIDIGSPAYNTRQFSLVTKTLGNFPWLEITGRTNVRSLSIGDNVQPSTQDIVFKYGAIIDNTYDGELTIFEENVIVDGNLNVKGEGTFNSGWIGINGQDYAIIDLTTDNWVSTSASLFLDLDNNFKISTYNSQDALIIDSVGDVLLSNNLNVDGGYLKVGNSVSGDRIDIGSPAYNTRQFSLVTKTLGNFPWLEITGRTNVRSLSIGDNVQPSTQDIVFKYGAIIDNTYDDELTIFEENVIVDGNLNVKGNIDVLGCIKVQGEVIAGTCV